MNARGKVVLCAKNGISQGSIKHCALNRCAVLRETEGDDETISIKLQDLPKSIEYFVFLVSCAPGRGNGTDFSEVSDGKATLRNVNAAGTTLNTLVEITGHFGDKLGVDVHSVIMCIFYRDAETFDWHVREVGRPCEGSNLEECATELQKAVTELVPEEFRHEQRMVPGTVFDMKKGDDVKLPDGCELVTIGLGWSCQKAFDLDASVLVLRDVDGDGSQDVVDVCWFKKLQIDFGSGKAIHQ